MTRSGQEPHFCATSEQSPYLTASIGLLLPPDSNMLTHIYWRFSNLWSLCKVFEHF